MDGGPYEFGPFRLDPAERRLTRGGEVLEVSGRYLDALALLVAEDGRLVTKDRFMDEVWRGVPVTDEALTQCIRSLRKALGDDASNPRVIETVPRHGYRLLMPVETVAAGSDAHRPDGITSPPVASRFGHVPASALAAALGGGGAGIVGGLGYLSLGIVSRGMGTASALVVLVSVTLVLGFVGGAFVGGGIALAGRTASVWRVSIGGALGGLLVGAIGRMVGMDLFTLLFGRAPASPTGPLEGLVIGAAAGLAWGVAARLRDWPTARRILPAIASGTAAGIVIMIAGGRLLAGTLVETARQFPDSKLEIAVLPPPMLAAATVAEATLFVTGVIAAMIAWQRMGRRD
ncbi:winged helix-turn-helix domain-containing protein [Tsuneonella amylolytica]|uniref:winged helix-turn-helix domain-containing protein n=1 Tax=Tsuneonella amylolytica TaxID=2338327 RepID=UPI000EA9CC22|nr:transcriptional regulator [Tsuneonella amylolytica]